MKIGWATLLLLLVGSIALGQTSNNAVERYFKWSKIYKHRLANYRINYLNKYLTFRTGDSAGLSVNKNRDTSLLVYLSLNEQNVALLKEFVDIPGYLFKDTLTMNLMMYQNYCLAAKRIGDRLFKTIPAISSGYKHIVLVMRAAAREKCFYVMLEQRTGVTNIKTADFLTNSYTTILWEESKYIYADETDPGFNVLVPGKKTFSVGDRICLVGFVFHPGSRIEIAPPTRDSSGVVFYRFYMNGYNNLSPARKSIIKNNLSDVIVPYVFRDSFHHYGFFILELASQADIVYEYWLVETGDRKIYKRMRTKDFLDFVLPGLPRENAHQIIEYKKKKTLFVEFSADTNEYWNYDTERTYYEYLAAYLYDGGLKYQRKVKSLFIRFKHSDGSKTEFAYELKRPVFKDMYKRAYFRLSGHGGSPAFYIKVGK